MGSEFVTLDSDEEDFHAVLPSEDEDGDWSADERAHYRAERESHRAKRGRVVDDSESEEVVGVENPSPSPEPLAWLMRTEPQPNEMVPQVGDQVVYLRRGHAQAVALYAPSPGVPVPPYLAHPELPNAVRCEVLQVLYVPSKMASPVPQVCLHVKLRVLGGVATPTSQDGAPHMEADAPSRSATWSTEHVPAGGEWLVELLPPAAGCADYLVLDSRYAHAQRQWAMCREGSTSGQSLSFRSAFLEESGIFEWYTGRVSHVTGDPTDLWESLSVIFGESHEDQPVALKAEAQQRAASQPAASGPRGVASVQADDGDSEVGMQTAVESGASSGSFAQKLDPAEVFKSSQEADAADIHASRASAECGSGFEGAAGLDLAKTAEDDERRDVTVVAATGAAEAQDKMSPWEIEVFGALPFAPPCLPERLQIELYSNLNQFACTDAAMMLDSLHSAGATAMDARESSLARKPRKLSSRTNSSACTSDSGQSQAVVPIDLRCILGRLQGCYYRQWSSVAHDIHLMLSNHAGSLLQPLADALRPIVLAAASEVQLERLQWRERYDDSATNGDLARAILVTQQGAGPSSMSDAAHHPPQTRASPTPAVASTAGSVGDLPPHAGASLRRGARKRTRTIVSDDESDGCQPGERGGVRSRTSTAPAAVSTNVDGPMHAHQSGDHPRFVIRILVPAEEQAALAARLSRGPRGDGATNDGVSEVQLPPCGEGMATRSRRSNHPSEAVAHRPARAGRHRPPPQALDEPAEHSLTFRRTRGGSWSVAAQSQAQPSTMRDVHDEAHDSAEDESVDEWQSQSQDSGDGTCSDDAE
jgi:hypothetical protein